MYELTPLLNTNRLGFLWFYRGCSDFLLRWNVGFFTSQSTRS
jgi:hypothetical protein